MNTLKRFNEVFVDLLRDLIQAVPGDTELRFYKTTVKTVLLLNKNLIRNIFENNMHSYRSAILNRDEQFLLECNFEDLKRAPDGIFMKIVGKLKQVWKSLPEKRKNVVWLHFHILFLMLEQMRESA